MADPERVARIVGEGEADLRIELVERTKQLKWLAMNILHHGPDLPGRTHWRCLYGIAEQAEVLAKQTLAKINGTATVSHNEQ